MPFKRCLVIVVFIFMPFVLSLASFPLSGTYQIGAGKTYTSINQAIDSLNILGVSGPVIFELTDETYDMEPDTLKDIAGAADTSRVIIRPAFGVTPVITISDSSAQFGLMLEETDYFTLDGSNDGSDSRDLTLQVFSNNSIHIIRFYYSALETNCNEIKNCIIKGSENNINISQTGISSFGSGVSYNTIENNHIYNVSRGINFSGQSMTYSISNSFINNLIGSIHSDSSVVFTGIDVKYQDSCLIANNEILNITNAWEANGIEAEDNTNLTISSNLIHGITIDPDSTGIACGISLRCTDPSVNTLIENNMIYHVAADPGGSSYPEEHPCGLKIYYNTTPVSNDVKVYHNSIYLSPDDSASINTSGDYSIGVLAYGADFFLDFRNNIVYNSLGKESGTSATSTYGYAMYGGSNNPFSTIDNNMYYITNQDNNYTGYLYSSNYASLSDWQSALSGDYHSQNQDPSFVSLTDLHIQAGQAVQGEKIPSVEKDIDKEPRKFWHIGADEQLSVLQLASDTITVNTSWSDDVVQVSGHIVIDNAATLTIAPGVWVEFQGYYKLEINDGALVAEGTEQDTILFTVSDTTGFSDMADSTGAWHGIRFNAVPGTNDTSKIRYCRIEYGKAMGPSGNDKGGGLFVNTAAPLRIEHSSISNNRCSYQGAGIYVLNSNKVSFEDCDIHHNIASSNGGGILFDQSDITLKKSRIVNNESGLNGGGIFQINGNVNLINNLVANNTASSGGGGIYLTESAGLTDTLINNTIAYNDITTTSQEGAGMKVGSGNADLVVYNTLFSHNHTNLPDTNNVLITAGSKADFYHCNSYGEYISNATILVSEINDPPAFVNPPSWYGADYEALQANFSLNNSSTSINAGKPDFTLDSIGVSKDLSEGVRIFRDTVDIGAYENRNLVTSASITGTMTWDADTVYVEDTLIISQTGHLTIKPGVVVVVTNNAKGSEYPIIVDGRLNVTATLNDTVTFIPSPGFGNWGGIQFTSTANTASSVSYAHVYIGDSDPIKKALLSVDSLNLTIENSKFTGGSWDATGILLNNSSSTIRDCYFDISYMKGITCKSSQDVKIKRCKFVIESDGQDAVKIDTSTVTIDSCDFITYNISTSNGYLANISNPVSDSVIIQYCTKEIYDTEPFIGVYMASSNEGKVYMNHNKMVDGQSLYCAGGDAFVTNNLFLVPSGGGVGGYPIQAVNAFSTSNAGRIKFYNNTAFNQASGFNTFFYTSQDTGNIPGIDVKNSIIWGFSTPIGGVAGTVGVSYSNIEYYSGGGTGNMDLYPEFIDTNALSLDLGLLSASPCINNGKPDFTADSVFSPVDYSGNPRVYNGNTGIIDMGAYEFQGEPTVAYASGHISDSVSWSVDTVFVFDTLWVDNGAVLTVNAGVTVIVYDTYTAGTTVPLIIDGELQVKGTSADSVRIIPYNDAYNWGGIVFNTGANVNSSIEYARIDIGYGTPGQLATIYSDGVDVSVSDASFYGGAEGSGYHLIVNNSNSLIENCFFDLSASFGIKATSNDSSEIFRSVFECPAAAFGYSPLAVDSSAIRIDSCDFYNYAGTATNLASINLNNNDTVFMTNSYSEKYAGINLEQNNAGTVVVSHSYFHGSQQVITNNSGKADFMNNEIYFAPSYDNITNKFDVQNNPGAAHAAILDFYNNTLFNASGKDFDVFYAYDMPVNGAIITCKNSIIYGGFTSLPVDTASSAGKINVSYSNVQMYYLGGTANLDTFPAFVDTSQATLDLRLTDTSACINAGKPDFTADSLYGDFDLHGDPRINGSAIDMGAYEYQQIFSPLFSLEKDTLDFGIHSHSTDTDTLFSWLRNKGNDTLMIDSITVLNAPFYHTLDTSYVLAADSVNFGVVFDKNNNPGAFSEMLYFYTNDGKDSILVKAEIESLVPPGNALSFNGTSSYVDLSDDTLKIAGHGKGTLMGWFRSDTARYGQFLFSMINENITYMGIGLNEMPYVNWDTTESFTFRCVGDAATLTMGVQNGNGYYCDDQWHHFAVVVGDGDNRIFIDGSRQDVFFRDGDATTQLFTNLTETSDLFSMSVGAYINSATKFYHDGLMDELSIWDHPLPDDSVMMYIHQSLEGNEAGLLAYYDFDQVSGITLPDRSPSLADGILTNMADSDWVSSLAIITPFIDSMTVESNDGFTVYWDSIPGVSEYSTTLYEDPCDGCLISPVSHFDENKTYTGLSPGGKYVFEVTAKMATGLESQKDDASVILPMNLPGNALNFSGVGQHAEVPVSSLLNPSTFTITAWVKPGNRDSLENVLGTLNSGDNKGYNFYNDKGLWTFGIGTGTGIEVLSALDSLVTGQWYHLAGTYDGSRMKFYLNGELQDSASVAYVPNTSRPLTFAKHSQSDAYYYAGGMDEVSLYNTALTEQDLFVRLHAEPDPEKEPNLVAYYNFDRIAGSELHDRVPEGTGGTLYGISDGNWKPSSALVIPFTRKAKNITDTSFIAVWDSIPDASSYLLEVSSDSLFTGMIDSLDISGTNEYSVDSLHSDSAYYYRVKASLPAVTSDWSNVMKVKTLGLGIIALEKDTVDFGVRMKSPGYDTLGFWVYNTGTAGLIIDSVSALNIPFDTDFATSEIPAGDSVLYNVILDLNANADSYEDTLYVFTGGFKDTSQVSLLASITSNTGIFTDARDGQSYHYITLGSQTWMTENLNYGDTVVSAVSNNNNEIIEKYCYNNLLTNCDTFGGLYSWNESMQYLTADSTQGICPDGWRLPSDEEWKVLENTVGMSLANQDAINWRGTDEGSALKAGGSSGFEAILGGWYYSGASHDIDYYGSYWASTQYDGTYAWTRGLRSDRTDVRRSYIDKSNGSSVRCIKMATDVPDMMLSSDKIHFGTLDVNTGKDSILLTITNTGFASLNISNIDGLSAPFSTLATSFTIEPDSSVNIYIRCETAIAAGSYIDSLLLINNDRDTSLPVSVTIRDPFVEICGMDSIQDIDGNWYQLIDIGNQCWMTSNLRVTRYSSGVAIPHISNTTTWANLTETDKAYAYYNNNASNAENYGAIYTWAGATNGKSSSLVPSGVQGACPDGWHVPSDAEWEKLAMYISDDMGPYSKSGDDWLTVGKHLKATSGWSDYNGTDDYGYEDKPAGRRSTSGSFADLTYVSRIWSSTEASATNAWRRGTEWINHNFINNAAGKAAGFSMRCLRDSIYAIMKTSEDTVDFGQVIQQASEDTLSLYIYNKGTDSLRVDSTNGVESPFAKTLSVPVYIAPGDSVLMDIMLDLSNTGIFEDTLFLNYSNYKSNAIILKAEVLVPNAPPGAFDDYVTICENDSVIIDVQKNDTDADGDALVTSILSAPLHGSAILQNADSISYEAVQGFSGNDTIVYQIYDGTTYDTAEVVITVNPLPVVALGNDTTINYNTTATLNGSASGGSGSFLYSWSPADSVSDASIPNPETVNLTLSSTFILDVTDALTGCTGSDEMDVLVTGGALTIVSLNASDTTICEGAMTELDVLAGGGLGSYSYTWKSTPADTSVQWDDTLSGIQVYPAETTTYKAIVTDGLETDSAAISITVNALPAITITGSKTICEGDSTILTASGGDSYVWSNGSPEPDITVAPTAQETFTVSGTGANGCSAEDSITVDVIPVITTSVNPVICQGESYNGHITSGIYEDTLTAVSTGCDSVVTVNLTVMPVYDTTISVDLCPGESYNGYSNTGTYTDTLSSLSGCDSIVTLDITVFPYPNAYAGPDDTICNGDTVTLTATGGIDYQWNTGALTASIQVSPDTASSYVVAVSDGYCTLEDTVTVVVNALPLAYAGSDTTVSYNTSAMLHGSASGGSGNYLYSWSPPDSVNNAGQSSTATLPLKTSLSFQLLVTDAETGCRGKDVMDVLVTGGALEIVDTSALPEEVCQGEEVVFSVLAGGGSGSYYYTWRSVTGDSILVEGENMDHISVWPDVSTTYRIIVDDGTEKDSADISVIVHSLPDIQITGADTVCQGRETVLTASGGDTYVWSTGHTTPSVSLFPAASQTVQVSGTDIHGCANVDSTEILVLQGDSIGIAVSICQGDSYNGHATTGVYTDTLAAFNGCDSIVTVNLTVIPNVVSTVSESICEGESYNAHSKTGFYVDTLTSVAGCDSIVELDLTVIDVDTTVLTAEICEGETFRGYGANGRFVEHYTNRQGCDSIVFIDITVQPLPLADAGVDRTIVEGDSTFLNASGGVTYLWEDHESLSRTDTSYVLAYPLVSHTYRVTVTDSFSCTAADSVTITVKKPLSEQMIGLSAGWNIFSMNIKPASAHLMDIVQPLIDSNQLVLVQDEVGNQVVNLAGTWYDFIGLHKPTEGYLINVSHHSTLTINGIDFEDPVVVNLTKGWNIMSYPEKAAKSSEEVLFPVLSGNTLKKAQDETGASVEFIDPLGWINHIGDFEPGEGYKIRVNATSYLFFAHQKKSGITEAAPPEVSRTNHFNPAFTGNGYHHMCIYIKGASIDGHPLEAGDEIGVFDGDLCVGSTSFKEYQQGFIPLKASKDDPTTTAVDGYIQDHAVSIRIWDDSENRVISDAGIERAETDPLRFREYGYDVVVLHAQANATDISPSPEFISGFGRVYPNPFSESITIHYQVARQENVRMAIYNLLGQKEITLLDEELAPGAYHLTWQRKNSRDEVVRPGIYLLRMKCGLHVFIKKITVE